MSVRLFFDKTAIIKRNKEISTNKYASTSTATAEVNIQQLDIETVERLEGVYGEEYVLFCDPSLDIREGDTVQEKSTQITYRVKEVILAQMFGIEHVKEVYITKLNE